MRIRPRRLRASAPVRDVAAEARVTREQLMMPHFVVEGENRREPIPTLPGVERVSVDLLVEDIRADLEHGLRSHLLFGVPGEKGTHGEPAADPDGPVPQALQRLRKEFGADELLLAADVCLCPYAEHGHCGVPDDHGHILNDKSIPLLAAAAAAYADAGADWVAPSDMMDGRVAAIREALDKRGREHVGILSYSAKYASAYYGPFRDAANSSPSFGDRKTYQMDPRNVREAVREVRLDVEEGADAVMVKPALAYLDVIRAVRDAVDVPVACYNVSLEYSLVKLAAERGLADEGQLVRENLHAMRRAGADLLITYHARDAVRNGWIG